LFSDPLAHDAVQVVERFADGTVTTEESQQVEARLRPSVEVLEERELASQVDQRVALRATSEALNLALEVVRTTPPRAAYFAAFSASPSASFALAAVTNPGGRYSDPAFCSSQAAEERSQCDILRCIVGNPFRPVTLSPAILDWNDSVVVRLAQAIYEQRIMPERSLDNGLLAILADALEEAGCTDTDILGHLRGPGPHVRGCWPVDLCLGKS
jgi:hypothetical protein